MVILNAVRKQEPPENWLLAALPSEQFRALCAHSTGVDLQAGQALGEPGDVLQHAYFLKSGTVSLLSLTTEGNTIEVGVVGNEGLVGMPLILSARPMAHRLVVQVPGEAIVVKASVLRSAFQHEGKFQELLLRYLNLLFSQLSVVSACNHFHGTEQRFCRWLLSQHDRVPADQFGFTHEFIAQALGVSRSSVTLVASRFQQLKLLRSARGLITLLDRAGLEARACECYQTLQAEWQEFLVPQGLSEAAKK